jgi:serine/threonine protein kinase/tetratricopeptide (TPR) repeat protein
MTADRWQKVEEVFHQALEQPEGHRQSWTENACAGDAELCAEVLSLLESDRGGAGGFVGARVEQAVRALGQESSPSIEGQRVGAYQLIRELGRGGMGAVYLAARADHQYESQVAIKLVRPGLDTDFIFRRFRRERQILARLEHPNIARLLDGGTTGDEVPYLVMEYVDGSWITKYAAERRLNVEERLRLFLPACAAVAHAHQHFIVHRDLKPGNILIDRSGAPKLLDFGISKLLHREAEETHDVNLMTPAYASPEQIVGDPVTTASDVYSLGAVLYELLSGVRPHRIDNCAPLALERAICLEETVPPSVAARGNPALRRRLTGDLDNIVLRAMQKAPERRYASVEQFADDVRRHLRHRPVIARPDSLWYRAGKFVRRNRVAVALTSVTTASLIAATGAALYQAHIAQERYLEVRGIASTFVFDVEAAVRDLPGSMRVRQLITRTGLEYLDKLSRNSARDWDLKRELAAAYQRIGDVQGGANTPNLGDPAAALASYKSAETLLDAVLAHQPENRKALLDWLAVVSLIGDLQFSTGQPRASIDTLRRGLQRVDQNLSAGQDLDLQYNAAVFSISLAKALRETGDLRGTAENLDRGVGLMRKIAAARPDDKDARFALANAYAQLGAMLSEQGQRDPALQNFRAGVAELEDLCRRFPLDPHARHELMLAYSHVGDTLGNPGFDNLDDPAGALDVYGKMVAAAKTLYEGDSADARAVSDYGIAALRFALVTPHEQDREKLQRLEQSHKLLTRAIGQNPQSAITLIHKAWAEQEMGDLVLGSDRAAAIHDYQMAAASSEAVLALDANSGAGQRRLVLALGKLAEQQARSGQREQAIASVNKALDLGKRVESGARAASFQVVVARAWQVAGAVYAVLGSMDSSAEQRRRDRDAAREWYTRAVAQWRRMETQPGFLAPYRKEMQTSIAVLAQLQQVGTPGSKP